jgi:hypothetical protein
MSRFALLIVLLCVITLGAGSLARPKVASAETTLDFFCSLGEQTFTVPAGVTQMDVELIGGHGATIANGVPARSDGISARLINLTPGQTLYLEVGCNSNGNAGGFNGGGSGGTGALNAFGGGGASDIRTSPRTVALAASDTRIIVAAGSGGRGANASTGTGGNGGTANLFTPFAGSDGKCTPSCSPGPKGGGAATSSAGGAGGAQLGGSIGSPGVLGTGGRGGNGSGSAGGGGGGYYGGGGGGGGDSSAGGAGGGAGIAYVAPGQVTSVLSGSTPEDPRISLKFVEGPRISLLATPGTVPLGGSSTLKLTLGNLNFASLTNISTTISLPAGLPLGSPALISNGCGGTVSASDGGSTVQVSGVTLSTLFCDISLKIVANTIGSKLITATPPTANEASSTVGATTTVSVLVSPSITSAAATSFNSGVLGSFTVTATGSPVPTITRTGTLPSGVNFVNNGNGTATLSGTPGSNVGGAFPLTFSASNGVGQTAVQQFTLNIIPLSGTAPAFTNAVSSMIYPVGTFASFTFTTTGSPTPVLTISGPRPGSLNFVDNHDGTATYGGVASSGDQGGGQVTITAANGIAPDAIFLFAIDIVGIAPVITSATGATFFVGTPGSFSVTATGTPTMSFSEVGALPAGLSFNPATGVLSGTPAVGSGGSYSLTITATNLVYPDATQSFILTVTTPCTAGTKGCAPPTIVIPGPPASPPVLVVPHGPKGS